MLALKRLSEENVSLQNLAIAVRALANPTVRFSADSDKA
jgi:hypothetical protein